MSLVGTHVSAAGGVWQAIERGEALGCESIQIFTRNQLQWRARPLSESACDRFMRAWRSSRIKKVVAHAPYLFNLAAEGDTRKRSIESLAGEIQRCDQLGIDDLVLHPGSHLGLGEEAGRKLVSDGLKQVIALTDSSRTRVLLETMSGQGNTLGSTLDELAWIFDEVDCFPRLGICLDTCHLFAGGYELRGRVSYERLCSSVERLFGLDNIRCWHLNDSKKGLGSRLDRHQHIGEGMIGSELFSCIVSDPRWNNTPCLLETPKDGPGDEGNLALLRKMRGF
ncbi:MAG TPA: deoxyribonuclease IV [Synergistales bacterium]|jgi:deoxyribonuclease-4|nr:deoxyribonuclease IV [Synergistales bacterium]HRV70663.1 deoxyribonuclease IV [Thermovirgaceae bacterium]